MTSAWLEQTKQLTFVTCEDSTRDQVDILCWDTYRVTDMAIVPVGGKVLVVIRRVIRRSSVSSSKTTPSSPCPPFLSLSLPTGRSKCTSAKGPGRLPFARWNSLTITRTSRPFVTFTLLFSVLMLLANNPQILKVKLRKGLLDALRNIF